MSLSSVSGVPAKTGGDWTFKIYFVPEADKSIDMGYWIEHDKLIETLNELLDTDEDIKQDDHSSSESEQEYGLKERLETLEEKIAKLQENKEHQINCSVTERKQLCRCKRCIVPP